MDPLDRRQFLAWLAAFGTGAAGWEAEDPPVRVWAQVTPFYQPPDGQRCLVRFVAAGLGAPAARLRVFDPAGRLLGTAGLVPRAGGELYGELWLAVNLLPRLRTELAAPGLSRPLVGSHQLSPAPKWRIYWLTVLGSDALQRRLRSLAPVPRAVETAVLRAAGAMVNPLPEDLPPPAGDLVAFHLVRPAAELARALGLEVSPLAWTQADQLQWPALAVVLAASGVAGVIVGPRPQESALAGTGAGAVAGESDQLFWLDEHSGGGRLPVLALASASEPVAGEFLAGGVRAARAMEQWLGSGTGWAMPDPAATGAIRPAREQARALTMPRGEDHRAAVMLTTQADRVSELTAAILDWNSRFAYPRIAPGPAAEVVAAISRAAMVRSSSGRGAASGRGTEVPQGPPVPEPAELARHWAARQAERERWAQAMIACLVNLLPGASRNGGLDAVAAQLAFPWPGALVFNPTSYARSELVRLGDGSERWVSDIPALGYAYVRLRGGSGGGWQPLAPGLSDLGIETAQWALRLDPASGAVASLVSVRDGRQWAGSAGLNAVSGARLEGVSREFFPGVGVRIVAQRRLGAGTLRSVVMLYEGPSWVDWWNDADGAPLPPLGYQFDFGWQDDLAGEAVVEWEVPAGVERGRAPCGVRLLRWLRLSGRRSTVVLASGEGGVAAVARDGTITCYAAGAARYRIAVTAASGPGAMADPWELGWGMEPVKVAWVPGTGGAALPSFGSLVVVDQPGVAVVGLEPEGAGDQITVYLQELSGRARTVTVGAGLIGFADARLVDLAGRDRGRPAMVMQDGVGLALAAHGVAAVRLLGVRLVGS